MGVGPSALIYRAATGAKLHRLGRRLDQHFGACVMAVIDCVDPIAERVSVIGGGGDDAAESLHAARKQDQREGEYGGSHVPDVGCIGWGSVASCGSVFSGGFSGHPGPASPWSGCA